MAVIISDANNPAYDGKLSTVNGFYRVEAYNIHGLSTTTLALSSARTISVTFANTGNCQGVVLGLYAAYSPYNDRSVRVDLQENTGSWVTRATATLTASEIVAGTPNVTRGWTVAFDFATPYAVTTAGSTWRFQISQTGGTSGTWNLYTSDGTNPMYITWCDNVATFNNNDCLVCKDTVIIDSSATIRGVLGTGDTVNAIAAVICNGSDLTADNVCRLVWENPPLSAYTFTVNGRILGGSGSGMRIGTSANPIPYAQKATVDFITPTVGSNTTSGFYFWNGMGSSNVDRDTLHFFAYGETPATRKTTLSADANASQADIVTTDSTGWAIGDVIFIGKEDGQASTNSVQFTIQSISGTNIALTSNLTKKRLAGASVWTYTGYGVFLTASTSASALWYMYSSQPASHFVMSGCSVDDMLISNGSHGTAFAGYQEDLAYCDDWLIENCVFWGASSTNYHFTMYNPTRQDVYLTNCYFAGRSPLSVNATWGGLISRIIIDGCIFAGINLGLRTIYLQSSLTRITMNNCRFENIGSNLIDIYATDPIITNNYFYGNGPTYGALCLGTIRTAGVGYMSGNTFNRNVAAIYIWGGSGINKLKDTGSTYGDEVANTYGFSVSAAALVDIEIENCIGIMGTTLFGVSSLIDWGTMLRFTNYNSTVQDFIYTSRGYFYKTGDGLVDTTVRTAGAGKYALRFEPTTSIDKLYWELVVPTGNIQNKTMTIAVWCKINNAAYYAGTHQKPRLEVDYDNGTVSYAEAVAGTGWQLLSVTFVPSTSYGQVTVTVSGRTDAAGSNAYFYVDDFAVLYPAGYKLDLGGLDLWANALPVVPPIATVLSANDVWGALDTISYGANTMGERMRTLLSTFDPDVDVVEGTITVTQALRVLLALLAGEASGGGTPDVRFRDQADTKDRVRMLVDGNGNRSSVMLDLS